MWRISGVRLMAAMRVTVIVAAMLAAMSWHEAVRAAQPVEIAKLKAAFIYNFAKFTEWSPQALPPGERLTMCVIGDYPVADALEQTIRGRSAEGHPLTVQILDADGPAQQCRIVFVGAADGKRSKQILDRVSGPSVLTVGDAPTFAESGGVAQLILENDRMRFAINVTAAEAAGLHLSSKLLTLATIVKGSRTP